MHEMHVVKDLFADVLKLATQRGASRVTKVYLRMGDFTEINEEVLRFFFREEGQGTALAEAQLVFEKSPFRELRLLSFDYD